MIATANQECHVVKVASLTAWPAAEPPAIAVLPLKVRRWRNGKIVWEGRPGERQRLHRRYPLPADPLKSDVG